MKGDIPVSRSWVVLKSSELTRKFYNIIFDIDNGANAEQDSVRYAAAKKCAVFHSEQMAIENPDQSEFWKQVKKEIETL